MSGSSSNPHGTTTNVDKCLTEAKPREGGGVVATYEIETPRTTVNVASLNESHNYVKNVMKR
ncbi:MAG: hypothetical protein K2X09_03980, partial [Rickettsiales bacterium]|nr:hypothetical protein [Rickettsiales bacterium]